MLLVIPTEGIPPYNKKPLSCTPSPGETFEISKTSAKLEEVGQTPKYKSHAPFFSVSCHHIFAVDCFAQS